jgi:hypothetical protein
MREAGHTVEALCVEAMIETGLRSGELRNRAPEDITDRTGDGRTTERLFLSG